MANQDDFIKTALRLPRDVHAQVQEAAAISGRSMNAEIVARLQDGFASPSSDNLVSIPAFDKKHQPLLLQKQLLGSSYFGGDFVYVRATGDSMAPVICDGDIVVLDRNRIPKDEGLFAFIFDGEFYIKQVTLAGNGDLALHSLNLDKMRYPSRIFSRDKHKDLEFIGSVVCTLGQK